jgi:CheY-like chemotaxis protein
MKVVIFDDELVERAPFYRMPGVELALFPHADDAAAVVRRERPDVVLMDFAMNARRTGAEAIAELLTLRKEAPLMLFIVAISTDDAANQRMLDAGADDAVPKSHVRGYLHKLLEKERLSRLHDRS